MLKAVNIVGNSPSSSALSVVMPAGAPSAPSGLSSSVSGNTATISFTAGANGGSALTNYQYSTDGGSTFNSFSPADTTSPVTITGLTYGTTYSIVLRAINSAGNGTSSSTLSVTVPSVVPFAPTTLSAGSITANSAVISFTPGANGGSAITNYQYSINGGTSFTSFSPAVTSSPVTISGLSGGTTYSVVLRAVNANGNGASSSSISVTTSNVSPSAPTALSSSEVGTTSAKISFSAGANGGSAITNYKYSTNGGTSFTAFSPAVTAGPVTITGLTSNTTYNIVIKAVNSVGDGSSSAALSVTTSRLPGSLLFGNSSRELALNPGAAMGPDAYTVECWFYNNSGWNTTSPFAALLGHSTSANTGQNTLGGLAIFFNSSTIVGTDRNGGDMRPTYTFANSITINAWHHFVLVRDSNNIETVFIDGVKAVSCGGGNNPTGGQQENVKNYSGVSVEIGQFYQGYWPGYLTNFRIVVGAAVYDPTEPSITVPTAALENIEGTQYLMVGDSITDDGSSTQTVTNVGGVTLSTTMVPL
jgi:titin